jgi:hypothetical protein
MRADNIRVVEPRVERCVAALFGQFEAPTLPYWNDLPWQLRCEWEAAAAAERTSKSNAGRMMHRMIGGRGI